MGVLNVGTAWIQAQRTDGTATTYNLLLNPNGGNVGIGTTNPGAKLDIRPGAAGTIGLIVQAASGQTSSLQKWEDSAGVVHVAVNKDGRLVFNNVETKQVPAAAGPELISAQWTGSDDNKLILWAGLTSDAFGRFLASARGFLEWGAGGNNDQDIALFRNELPGLSIQNFTNTKSTRAFSVNAEYNRALGLANEEYPLFAVNTQDRSMRLAPGIVAASGVKTFAGSDYVVTRGEKKTTDATAQTLATIALGTPRSYYITAKVVGRRVDGATTDRAFFYRAVLAFREGGAADIQGTFEEVTNPIKSANAGAWDLVFTKSGNDILVQVKGFTSQTVYWVGMIEYQSVETDA